MRLWHVVSGFLLALLFNVNGAASETIGRYQVAVLPGVPARGLLEPTFVLVDTATGQSWYMANPGTGVDHPRWMPLRFLTKPPELVPLPPSPAATGTDVP